MATVIPPFDRFQGVRGFSENLVAGILRRQQEQRTAQQLQGLGLPGGLTSPVAQQFAGRQALGQQDIFGRIAAAQAKPVSSTQQIAQQKLNLLQRLQAIPEAQRTPAQQAQIDKILVGGPQVKVDISPQNIVTNTLKVRTSFSQDPRIKDIRIAEKFTANIETAFQRSLTSKNLGPVDIALAKSFQKLTDLGSSVREGEFATTFEGQKLINKIRGKIDAVTKGGLGFTEEERREIRDLTRVLINDSKKLFNQAIDETTVTAQELGLNTRAILGGRKKFNLDTLSPTGEFRVGQTVTNNGQQMVITGFDTDGTPLGEPVR